MVRYESFKYYIVLIFYHIFGWTSGVGGGLYNSHTSDKMLELTVAQIIWLAKTVILAIAIIYTISEVIPTILEAVIIKKQCENKQKPFQRILSWIKERKKEKTEDDYLRRWMK